MLIARRHPVGTPHPRFPSGGVRPNWPFRDATLDLDFANNRAFLGRRRAVLTSLLTTTRASVGYAQDTDGVWSSFASNTPRITNMGLLVEEARTNSIRNNSMQGAVAGTPGTQPTNWEASFLLAGGTSTKTTSLATVQGIDFIFAALSGTPAASTFSTGFDATTQIAASAGQVWTGSVFAQKTAGDFTGFSAYTIALREYDSGGSFLRQTTTDISGVGSAVARYTVSATLGASTAYVQLAVRYTTTGVAIGLTIGFGWPQLELGSFVTSPIRTTTAAATRAADSTTTANVSWANISGTLFAEIINPSASPISSNTPVFSLHVNSQEFSQIWRWTGNANTLNMRTVVANVTQAANSTGDLSGSNIWKGAYSFNTNDFRGAGNGTLITADTSGSLTSAIASGQIGAINSYVRRLAYFKSNFTNAQLQALTS